ncbi:MAG: Arm DNA-binding domain-containing protein, partial [Gammaproteobacteria bacterium]|nr:Arm DNA-binding domain-containing protein [Gammaproteobacteria bacterium]
MKKRKVNRELTEELVALLKYDPEGSKVQYVWDGKTTGFCVRLYPSGKKSYVVGYRARPNTRMKFAVIGKVGQMKVRPARDEAARILANNEDPIQEKQDQVAQDASNALAALRNPSMSKLIEDYFSY